MRPTGKERQELIQIGRMLCNSTDRVAIRAHLDKLPDDSPKMNALREQLHKRLESCIGSTVRITASGVKVRNHMPTVTEQATQQTAVSLPIQVVNRVKKEVETDKSEKISTQSKTLATSVEPSTQIKNLETLVKPSIVSNQQDASLHVAINYSVIFKVRPSDSNNLFSVSIQGAEIAVILNKEHPMCAALFISDIQRIQSGASIGHLLHEPARMLIEGWALMEATTTGPAKERLSQIREEWGRKLGKVYKTL